MQAALSLLSENGVMVVHDCAPAVPEIATPEYQGGDWSGVTYHAYVELLLSRHDLAYQTVDTDYGCAVVRKKRRSESWEPRYACSGSVAKQWRSELDDRFAFFRRHRFELVNLVSAEEFVAGEGLPLPWNVRLGQFLRRRAQ